MTPVEEDLAYTLSELGALGDRAEYPAETIEWLHGRVPDSMINLLSTLGIGTWGKGKWQTLDPRKYDGLLRQTFEGDPDFSGEDCTAFAVTGFGELECWHKDYRRITLSVLPNTVFVGHFFSPNPLPAERSALTPFSTVPENAGKYSDLYDKDGKGMFARLIAAHGPLKPGQIFAPRLHPAIGGSFIIENFRPASAPEAIALLHQMEPFVLEDQRKGQTVRVRMIGPK